jgi:ketosteroid isomerase-like protein
VTSTVIALALSGLTGCVAKKIPGTDIDDNDDTRAVLALFQEYKKAVEARDAQAVMRLCDESFSDDGGSASPDDDLVYSTLAKELPARFSHVQDVRLEMAIRKIEVSEDANVARVTYSYTLTFRMPRFTSRAQSETDIKQMTLKKVGEKAWKITSGI